MRGFRGFWHGIEMIKASWAVLKQDKELMALPLIAGAILVILSAAIGYPLWNMIEDAKASTLPEQEFVIPETVYVLGFFGYWILNFVALFFNGAVVHAANERLSGGNPTVASAISGASRHVGRLLAWALISTTVILIINELVDRLGGLFRIIGMVVELAWKALTYLAVPVLILEGAGPVDAGYRSAKLIKETWGEGLTGHIGLSAVRGVATLFILLLVGMAYLAGTAMFYAAIPLAVIAMIAQMTLFSALAMIFQTVLYRHATGAKDNGFNRELVNGAFFTKDGSPTTRTANAAGLPEPFGLGGRPTGLGTLAPPDHFDEARYQVESEFQEAPAVDFKEPQDWSKLPDEWTS